MKIALFGRLQSGDECHYYDTPEKKLIKVGPKTALTGWNDKAVVIRINPGVLVVVDHSQPASTSIYDNLKKGT